MFLTSVFQSKLFFIFLELSSLFLHFSWKQTSFVSDYFFVLLLFFPFCLFPEMFFSVNLSFDFQQFFSLSEPVIFQNAIFVGTHFFSTYIFSLAFLSSLSVISSFVCFWFVLFQFLVIFSNFLFLFFLTNCVFCSCWVFCFVWLYHRVICFSRRNSHVVFCNCFCALHLFFWTFQFSRSQLIVSPRPSWWDLEKSYTRKYMRHLDLIRRFLFKDNWMKELGSEVAGGSSSQTQPKTKNLIVRTGDLLRVSNNPVRVLRKSTNVSCLTAKAPL